MNCVPCQTVGLLYLLKYMLNLMIWAINIDPSVISEGHKGAREANARATALMESSWQIFVIPRVLKEASAQKTLGSKIKMSSKFHSPMCFNPSHLSSWLTLLWCCNKTCFRHSVLFWELNPFNDLRCSAKTIQKHNKRYLKVRPVFIISAFFSWPSISNFFSKLVKWKAVKSEEKN